MAASALVIRSSRVSFGLGRPSGCAFDASISSRMTSAMRICCRFRRHAPTLAALESIGADCVVALDQDERALSRALEPHFSDGVDVVLDYLWERVRRRC